MVSPFGIKRLGTPNARPQLPRIDRGSPLLRQWESFSPAEREALVNRLIIETYLPVATALGRRLSRLKPQQLMMLTNGLHQEFLVEKVGEQEFLVGLIGPADHALLLWQRCGVLSDSDYVQVGRAIAFATMEETVTISPISSCRVLQF